MTRIWSDDELRAYLAVYERGAAIVPDSAAVLVPTVRVLLEQRDEARARCVELLGRAPGRTGKRAEELQTAHDELAQAALEAHGPDVDSLIDAMLALLAYVERMPAPPEAKR